MDQINIKKEDIEDNQSFDPLFVVQDISKSLEVKIEKSEDENITDPLLISSENLKIIIKEENVESEKSGESKEIVEQIRYKKPTRIDICKNRLQTVSSLKKPVSNIRKKLKYQCELCSKEFSTKWSMVLHMKSKSKCDLFDISFHDKALLSNHYKSAHNNASSKTKIEHLNEKIVPKKVAKNVKVKKTKNIPNESKILHKYKCTICDNIFKTLWNLQQHKKKIHENVLELKCHICEKKFNDKSKLDIHFKGHEKIFSCEICDKMFASNVRLESHNTMVHVGVNFKCDLCLMSFKSKYTLKGHKSQIHFQEKIHFCIKCQKTFTSNQNLKVHNETIHEGLKKYKCDFCEKSFGHNSHKKDHAQRVHLNDLLLKKQ